MYLDALHPLQVQVGYGDLGLYGSLGYEGKGVSVGHRHYQHAFSAHPPSRLLFYLGGRFKSFTCSVGLNDDVPAELSYADFIVLADGRRVAVESYVRAGEAPRQLRAEVSGAGVLELLVETSRWNFCHAVWLDPELSETQDDAPAATLNDCLQRAEIELTALPTRNAKCIATVVSNGFEGMLDDMLGSLTANGGYHDALLLVFALDDGDDVRRVAAKYNARLVRCRSLAHINPMSKSLLYSVARVADAEQYVCLDADMLVLGDLQPVFSAIEACPEGSLFACREGNHNGLGTLGEALRAVYGGDEWDFEQLGITPEEAAYKLVVNDGLFAGGRAAMLALDGVIRSMPQAVAWTDGHPNVWWRNQFIFNLALARLGCGVELDSSFNVQLHAQDVQFRRRGARVEAEWRGRPARVLHFSGGAKRKYPEWQGLYMSLPDPLARIGGGQAYEAFLAALRSWIGRHGMKGLAWSFYGTTDGSTARVLDSSTFPLLATLHYLIRSNGCIRVLETGTARGISAACLASAVAHRRGGRVVTLDPYLHPERGELWATLPETFSVCIEQRTIGAIEGMTDALAAGERYDAALLDSIHTEEHVWAEFQLASQLVCEGGLILIHDAAYRNGTVEGALRRIEDEGYGVVRLWTAEEGVNEDDHLGLALVENRRRKRRGLHA